MMPREHGAYFMLLLPLISVLLGGRPRSAAALWTLAALSAFVAHEPLLVLAGRRGKRAKRDTGRDARTQLWVWSTLAIVFGAAGYAMTTDAANYALLVPIGIAGAALALALQGLERTALGELTAGAALTCAALPIGIASGLEPRVVGAVVAIWLLTTWLNTTVVRATVKKTRAKTPQDRTVARVWTALAATIAIAAIGVGVLGLQTNDSPWWLFGAVLPTSIVALIIALSPLTARHIAAVGWSLAAAGVVTLTLIVLALRTMPILNRAMPALVGY